MGNVAVGGDLRGIKLRRPLYKGRSNEAERC
uniref:Uncharacterized protein n=1 Tax=Arundo donax TaxID=35708 RepID=A0A0A8ZPM5_ARUDO